MNYGSQILLKTSLGRAARLYADNMKIPELSQMNLESKYCSKPKIDIMVISRTSSL